jgi:glyoxylase-like metal-dependent hydrolase (beta-lactamase superfamily II)
LATVGEPAVEESPMIVELLPSSVPASEAQFLVSFLVNGTVAIDAGPLGLLADLERQRRVRHVLLTHEHIDHLATLPIFLENVYEPGPECVEILAAPEVLALLRQDIFNGRIWPDFFALSAGSDRFVSGLPLEAGRTVERAGLAITPLAVSHSVDTLGLLVDDGKAAVAFPSDTGPTEAIWATLAAAPRLDAVFLELSFPNRLAELAATTGHLCPATFAAEIRKLERPVRWIVVHRKPRYAGEIASELAALELPNVELVAIGKPYSF